MTEKIKAVKPKKVTIKDPAAPKKRVAKKPFFLKRSQEFLKGRQSAICETHLEITAGPLKGAKIRTTVKSDSYKFQSYAVLDIWKNDELKWSRVCNIHYSAMSTKEGLYVYPNIGLTHFIIDNQDLLTKAEMILA